VKGMQPGDGVPCPQCGTPSEKGYPFCLQCGELQPGIVARGPVSVELQEVASAKIREEVVEALKSWFPAVDVLNAESALKRGKSILINGIDEDSAGRIVRGVKSITAGARITRGESQARSLFNGGLVVSALALIATAFSGWGAAILFLLAAAGAPFVGALLKRKGREPLVPAHAFRAEAEKWIGLSSEYAQLVGRVEPRESELLRSIARGGFDLRERLAAPSLAASAAGEPTGELFERIQEILHSAVAAAGRMSVETGDKRDAARGEIANLNNLVDETTLWFQARESGDVKEGAALADDLRRVKQSIDSILREVRSPEMHLPGERTRA